MPRKPTIYRKQEDQAARYYLEEYLWQWQTTGYWRRHLLDRAMFYATLAKYDQ